MNCKNFTKKKILDFQIKKSFTNNSLHIFCFLTDFPPDGPLIQVDRKQFQVSEMS